jgi:hypothetical protein
MLTPLFSRPAGRAGSLLLVLALAACGGSGGDDSPKVQDTTIRTARAPDGGRRCPPPPAIDPIFLADSSWAALGRWRTSHQVNFVGGHASATAWVPLEAGQPVVPVTISPERRTHCLSANSLNGQTRLAGSFVVQRAVTLWGQPLDSAAVILVFATDTTGPAVLAFQSGDTIATAPATAWKFNFCRDGHPHDRSKGEWRRRIDGEAFVQSGSGGQPGGGQPGGGQPGGRPHGPRGPRDDDEVDPGTYGWMACANGCCQFYIPPVGNDDDLHFKIPPKCIVP